VVAQGRVLEDLVEGAGHLVRMAVHQDSGAVSAFRDATAPRCHDRRSDGHGLEHGQPEAFIEGRVHEHFGVAEQGCPRRVVDVAGDHDPRSPLGRQRLDGGVDGGPGGTVAPGEDESEIGMSSDHVSECRHEVGVALAEKLGVPGGQGVAVTRVAAEVLPDPMAWQAIAALGWLVAFAPWVARIGRIYLAPRADGRPG